MARRVDWTLLPEEMVRAIARRINEIIDYVHFRRVCAQWHSYLVAKPRHLPLQSPWLMLPSDDIVDSYTFVCLPTGKAHRLPLPEARRKRCCGSSHGWIIMLDACMFVSLLNPVTGEEIPLPRATAFPSLIYMHHEDKANNSEWPEFFIGHFPSQDDAVLQKIVLSSNPENNQEYIAIAIVSKRIAYYKPDATTWRMINEWRGPFTDCMYHNDKFYVVDCMGGLLTVEFSGPTPTIKLVVPCGVKDPTRIQRYVVEMDGGVFMVCKIGYKCNVRRHPRGIAVGFAVYKLQLDREESGWLEVEDIGGRALFLGVNHSFSFPSETYPGFQKNCIYFTDDFCWQLTGSRRDDEICNYNDLGVFDMFSKQISPFSYYIDCSRFTRPTPKWVTLNTYGINQLGRE